MSIFFLIMYKTILKLPKNIQIITKENNIFLKGPLATISLESFTNLKIIDNQLYVFNKQKSLQGLHTSLLKKKIIGILQGFKLNLYLKGIGLKASISKNNLILKLGYSHVIELAIPKNINVSIHQPTVILLSGIDWGEITQYAAKIKHLKKPEPYKGKGILFKNENLLRKEGKKK